MGPLRARRHALILAVLFSFLLTQLAAQQTGQSDPANAAIPDACLQRNIPLTVLPRGQQLTPELKQVQVFINASQISIAAPTVYAGSLRVLLLVDTSASMGPPKGGGEGWGIGLQTAAFATDAVPAGAAVSVGTFAEKVQTSEWGDRDRARTQVLQLKSQQPKGRTALYLGPALPQSASLATSLETYCIW